jgi:hypothetical protein
MPKTYYHVAPRYTAGSPAQVSREIAERVILQEQDGYQRALEGVYGAEDQQKAETLGLTGIVYTTTEIRNRWIRHDLLTDVTTTQRIKDGVIVPLDDNRKSIW